MHCIKWLHCIANQPTTVRVTKKPLSIVCKALFNSYNLIEFALKKGAGSEENSSIQGTLNATFFLPCTSKNQGRTKDWWGGGATSIIKCPYSRGFTVGPLLPLLSIVLRPTLINFSSFYCKFTFKTELNINFGTHHWSLSYLHFKSSISMQMSALLATQIVR